MSIRSAALGAAFGLGLVVVLGGAAWFLLLGPQLFPSAAPAGMLGDPNLVLTPQQQAGEALYIASCADCHGGPSGGSMMDYPPRHNANGHTWHHPDCQLARIVRDGGDEMTESMRETMASPDAARMPAFRDQLTAEEIDAVLAYIKLMWTAEQRSVQAHATREICLP